MVGVVGSTNVDVVMKVKSFTLPGQTQRALSLEEFPGGKGANQAVSVAKFSRTDSVFITLVGEDGRWLLERFERLKIKGPRIKGRFTGRAFIEVTEDGENRIIIHGGANDLLVPEEINWDLLEKVDIVLLQNEIPFQTTLEVARFARERGKRVVFDPAPASGIDGEILKYTDFLTPNENELVELSKEFLGGFESVEKSVEKFLKMGVGAVLVKMGEKGVFYSDGLKTLEIRAPKVEAVDTTAAGDVFNGIFASALDSGNSILRSLRLAVFGASLSVTRMGAQTSIPEGKEVIEFERRYSESQD